MLEVLLRHYPPFRAALATADRYQQENIKLRHDMANLQQIVLLKGCLSEAESYALSQRILDARQTKE